MRFFNRTQLLSIFISLFMMGHPLLVSAAPALSSQTLQNDIRYYSRVTQQQNLNFNDRYYILLRIEDKYRGTPVDLAPLKKEMQQLESEINAPSGPAPDEPALLSTLSSISYAESDTAYRIEITASKVKHHNQFLLRDPDDKDEPKLVVDFYGVTEQLPSHQKSIMIDTGPFAHIKAGQFETQPNQIVRLVITLRSESPYTIKKENDTTWSIISKKDKKTIKAAVQGKLPSSVPSTTPAAASPLSSTGVGSTYSLEIGDVIGVGVSPAEELSRDVIVQPDSYITFPLVGALIAKGLTPQALEKELQKGLAKYISNPKVTITLKKFSTRQIFITGEVRSVGTHNYRENLRLMEFVSSLGGFTKDANRTKIKIFRGPAENRQTYFVDVEEITKTGDFSKDFLLMPGDIIEVPKGMTKVSMLGAVNDPGYYDYYDGMKLLDLVSMAGGFPDTASLSKVSIVRTDPEKGNRESMTINLSRILSGKDPDYAIKTGDIVYIPKKGITQANWFLNNVMPWLSLAILVYSLQGR